VTGAIVVLAATAHVLRRFLPGDSD
jgi:hypothetical protein